MKTSEKLIINNVGAGSVSARERKSVIKKNKRHNPSSINNNNNSNANLSRSKYTSSNK